MRAAKSFVWSALALLFLFEEWVWRVCGPLAHRLVALLPLARIRGAITRLVTALPPLAALLLFIIPAIVIFPFKLAGLWLIAHGQFLAGAVVFLAAKTIGFGLAAFLFDTSREKLLQIGWFARLHALALRISAWAHRQIAPVRLRLAIMLARLRRRITAQRPRH